MFSSTGMYYEYEVYVTWRSGDVSGLLEDDMLYDKIMFHSLDHLPTTIEFYIRSTPIGIVNMIPSQTRAHQITCPCD